MRKKNEWIPCSERLPENETNVIANFSSGIVTELRHVANGIFHGIYEYSTKVIVAWRPPRTIQGGMLDGEKFFLRVNI